MYLAYAEGGCHSFVHLTESCVPALIEFNMGNIGKTVPDS